MRYLDPKNDLVFKKIFGQYPHLLRSLLNGLLPLREGQEIVSLKYLPSDLVPEVPDLKYSIVDVRCTDNYERQFIVEMQMLWTDSFKYRVLFNASKAYVKQLERGSKYKGLKPVYALSLVNETYEHDTEQYYHHYAMTHSQLTHKQIEGLELIFVELPKFKAKNLTEKKLQILWLRYLTEIEEHTEHPPEDLQVIPEIKEAIEQLAESAFTRAELEAYDKYWDNISSERTLIAEAEETGLSKGKAEGRAEGKAEGKVEGRAEGMQLAMQVIKLHRAGVSPHEIAEQVGITEAEVVAILAEMG